MVEAVPFSCRRYISEVFLDLITALGRYRPSQRTRRNSPETIRAVTFQPGHLEPANFTLYEFLVLDSLAGLVAIAAIANQAP